jgi:hypothetical protein
MQAEWDWHKKIESWNFQGAAIHDFPAWERVGNFPPYVKFEIVDREYVSSRDMAIAWDEVILSYFPANGAFDYSDYTSSGTPFLRNGEKYWACFTFQYEKDARAFQGMFGGIGSWDWDIRELEGKIYCERGRIAAYPSLKLCSNSVPPIQK